MELYSKEELLKELKKEYSCGGECDHCPEVLDAGSCSVLRCIRRIIDNASPVFSCNACKYMGNEWECRDCHDYSNYVHYEERTQGKWHEFIDKGLLKARHGNYVVYDVDYLLDHLAREVCIMESARKMKGGAEE